MNKLEKFKLKGIIEKNNILFLGKKKFQCFVLRYSIHLTEKVDFKYKVGIAYNFHLRDVELTEDGLKNGEIYFKFFRVNKRKQFTKYKRKKVWQLKGDNCYYCKKPLINYLQETIDHLTPLSRGGSNDLENLVFCCKACNGEKKDMTEIEYINYKINNR